MPPGDPLSVVLVTPRFWPLADERALRALAVARRLAASGVRVTVLTPQWDRQWSCQMALDEVQVVRLKGAPCGGLGSLRWSFHLARWLRRQRPTAVVVVGMQHEAGVALAAGRRGGWPTVLLAQPEDPVVGGQTALGRRMAAACRQAAAVVAPSARLAEELARWGVAPVELIPWGADTPPRQDALLRDAARRALAAVNPDLVAPPALPVVLTVASLAPSQQLEHVIGAWPIVAARRPDARLWIVGDGPLRERLYRQIQDLDLRFRVLLPGTFDSLEELCHAADALLVPAAWRAPPLALVEGMAAGLSLLVPQSPLADECPPQEGRLWRFPPADRAGIAAAVLAWLDGWQPPPPHGLAPPVGAGTLPATASQLQAQRTCPPAPTLDRPPEAHLADPAATHLAPMACSAAEEGRRLAALLRRLVEAAASSSSGAPPRAGSPPERHAF